MIERPQPGTATLELALPAELVEAIAQPTKDDLPLAATAPDSDECAPKMIWLELVLDEVRTDELDAFLDGFYDRPPRLPDAFHERRRRHG